MAQSKILQIYHSLMENEMKIDRKTYEKELDNMIKWNEILDKHVGDDEKFHAIFREYDLAVGLYEGVMCEQFYKQGFLLGAQLMLEICCHESIDKNKQ